MAGGVQISRDLEAWAETAGFSLTPVDRVGRAVFSSSNGETRYFIEQVNDEWLRVTCSDRTGPRQLELAAPSLSTIEKYFYGFFGSNIRDKYHLKQATPVPQGDFLTSGYKIRRLPDAGQDYLAPFDDADQDHFAPFDEADQGHFALFDARERVTAVDGFGEVLARIRLSDLAVYLSHPTEEIKDSFEDPNGGTLLNVNAGEIA
jgi:hypothetical protein